VAEQTATAPTVARPLGGARLAARAGKLLLLGPVLPGTWRRLVNLVESLLGAAAFATVLLGALAGGLAWLAAVTLAFATAAAARFLRRAASRGAAGLIVRPISRGGLGGSSPRGSQRRMDWAADGWLLLAGSAVEAAAILTEFDRSRVWHLTGSRIAAEPWPQTARGTPLRQRQREWLESPVARRAAGYQLARLPAIMATQLVVALALAIVVIGLTNGDPGDALTRPAGIACIFGWPVAVRLGSALDVALARALLGPSRTGQLSAEVQHLGAARASAVESADSERRRIERDLHDGLQPRLVSLALELGLARSRFERDPQYARALLDKAHEEAKIAIQDLRGLVRGIHPSVLDERGLDAALSALVASCAVPVRVDVSLITRPGRAQEAVAYFVAAEAITNVTKHSSASAASVTITDDGTLLRVLVEDDGKGGAVIEPGGGLAGLAARVAAIDGTLTVTSPSGGPTLVAAVIPCGR
jgi:signal transduction histidine kinase